MTTGERAEAGSRRAEILGRIDIADASRVSGWAWDQARPEQRLEVQIWHGDQQLGTTVADRERADLKRNGVGDGCHAFQFKLGASGFDLNALVAKVDCPDMAEPVPLFRPSETQTVVERTVLMPFVRLQKTLDLIAERQLKLARACEQPRGEQRQEPHQASVLLDRLVASQERIEQRLQELDVFQARFDGALRALSEQAAAGTRTTDGPLKRVVAVLAGCTLVCCCAIGLLVLARYYSRRAVRGRVGWRAEIDLSDLVRSLLEVYEPVAEDAGRRLAARIEDGLSVRGDRELLTQMLVNLIENGLRHTPPGTRVKIRLQRTGGEI
jgi:hypothetical protein